MFHKQGASIISIILGTNECCKEELLKECIPQWYVLFYRDLGIKRVLLKIVE